MITRGCVIDTERSIDLEPGAGSVLDLSRYSNDGAFTGAGEPNWVQLPSGLWVMLFDGVNDAVNHGNDVSLDIPGPMTVLVWIKEIVDEERDIASKWSGAANRCWLLSSRADGLHRFYTTADGTAGTQVVSSLITRGTLGLWHLLAGVYDGTNATTILDAVPGTPQAQAGIFNSPAINVRVATAVSGGAWNGYGGFLRLANYALSPGQIRNIYESERWLFGV